jgi:hypothetical protein
MDYLVYYIARDRKTGRLFEDSFVQTTQFVGLRNIDPNIAKGWILMYWDRSELELLDSDGPFPLFGWPLLPHFRYPKWRDVVPAGVDAIEWKRRFRSRQEWQAYRQGLESAS